MSIGILINIHDGIVLAADSASTLTAMGAQTPLVLNVYNNANKIVNLQKGKPIGCVAFGSGSIGSASISTLLKDFRRLLGHHKVEEFDPTKYTMEDVAKSLLKFLVARIADLQPGEPKPTLGILLGGYSKGKSLGQGWELQIENGVPKTPRLIRPEGETGINWGGELESIHRLILGFSSHLLPTVAKWMQPPPSQEQMAQLHTMLMNTLQAPVAFAPMPIKDAIDLAEWLVHTAMMFARFAPGPTSVGGPIEIAAITKHEGFKWIQRKYYFEQSLNPEVSNEDNSARQLDE